METQRLQGSRMNFYHFSLCHLCKEPSPNLKRCVKCKIVHYCSREHQVQDWAAHKNECRLLTAIKTEHAFTPCLDPGAFTLFKMQGVLLVKVLFGSSCTMALTDMFLFPRVCGVCFSENVEGSCDDCLSVCYCSEVHKNMLYKNHALHCQALKQCLDVFVEAFKMSSIFISTHIIPVFSEVAEDLPNDHSEVVKILKILPEGLFESDSLVLSDIIAYATNMIYALETCKFVEKRKAKKTKLVIHIVVTEQLVQTDWFFLIEFLAHWMANLKDIKIIFVGRNVPVLETYPNIKCERCNASKVKRGFSSVHKEYFEVCRGIPKSDLIVLYDQEIDPLFLCYIPSGVPVLMTALSGLVLMKNAQTLPKSCVNVVVDTTMNKYASVRPHRNMVEGEPPVFYRHRYATIFIKK